MGKIYNLGGNIIYIYIFYIAGITWESKSNIQVIDWTCHNNQVFLQKKTGCSQNTTTFPEPDVVSSEYEEDVTRCYKLVCTPHWTLPDAHIRPYSHFTLHSITFDPTYLPSNKFSTPPSKIAAYRPSTPSLEVSCLFDYAVLNFVYKYH